MVYELKALEQIVAALERLNKLKPGKPDAAALGKYKRLAHLEKERIKLQFIHAAFEPGSEGRIALYFRQHQSALIQLSDTIYSISKTTALQKLAMDVLNCMDFLLDFIETKFTTYFDREMKIPEMKRWQVAPEVKHNLKFIQTSFKQHSVPADLITISCKPLEDFLLPDTVVSYHAYYITRDLQHELLLLSKLNTPHNFPELICNRLFFLNVNCLQFFNYYIDQLTEACKKHNSTQEQIEFYSMELKLINQVVVKPDSVYNPKLPSLCMQVGTWLAEEIYFLEKKKLLMQFSSEPSPGNDFEPKVHTSLSVANLSLAIKLLIDAGIIKNKNATELMKLVARNFKTDKREDISEDSLRNKAYNVDVATVDRMKDVIKGLMGVVMRY